MVVNRKQPITPAPLIQSRSTSQQPIVTRKKQSKFTSINGIDSHKPEHVPSTNSDPKPKSTSRRPRKKSLRDKLLVWSLSLFTLYSFLLCSPYTTTPQKSQSHLICRAETGYKTFILDPVILPPLKYTLSFTNSLAKPYISRANTHLEPYLAPVKQATSTLQPYVMQTATAIKRVWEATLVPFYKNTLKPYYQLAILPRYNLYLRPYFSPLISHMERYYAYYVSNPLRIQANRMQLHFSAIYATHIHSYISQLQPYIRRSISAVHTIWLSSVYLYGSYIQPTLQSTWIQAQPHLSFALDQAKDISSNAAAGTAKHFRGLAKQVGTQRRTYVDPHIRKIWDKVEENATAKTTMAPPAPVDISLEEETAESTITAPLAVEKDAQDVLHPADPTSPSFASTPPASPDSTSAREAQSAGSIAEASAHGASTALYELKTEVETLVGGNVAKAEPEQSEVVQAGDKIKNETPKEPATSATKYGPEVISNNPIAEVSPGDASPSPSNGAAPGGVIGVGASSPSTFAAEDDLDDFLRDIGMDTSSSSSSPSPSPTSAQLSEADEVASPSPQEAEASRLNSIASKRLAITTRHAAFEADLQSSILTSTSQIIEKLGGMRDSKKEELTHMIEGTSEGEAGLVADLTSNGDKLMKGLDVYLKKCQARSGTWKQRGVVGNDDKKDEKDIQKRTGIAKAEQARLESVIEKVEIKFLDGVQKLQEQVNGWYLGMIEKEQEEILQIATKIKNMAEQAQADLGLDYAWLEDVTYMDWQRYHDLVRASEKFVQTANAIQNGTSVDPLSPPNPVNPVINALQEELHTVVLGFHVALDVVRNTIPELFSIYESVPGHDDSADAGEEDKVRIQPIDPAIDGESGEKTRPHEEDFDPSKVIIGKSKEQVEQALGSVPLVVKHEEL